MLAADLSRDAEANDAVSQAITTLGGIDVLVNAAGHISNGTIENISLQAWDEMLNVNVRAIFNLMQSLCQV
jgi:NAD(P)-dependent dehydrogenase (short-subunit alcohol dehydrogenase family)